MKSARQPRVRTNLMTCKSMKHSASHTFTRSTQRMTKRRWMRTKRRS